MNACGPGPQILAQVIFRLDSPDVDLAIADKVLEFILTKLAGLSDPFAEVFCSEIKICVESLIVTFALMTIPIFLEIQALRASSNLLKLYTTSYLAMKMMTLKVPKLNRPLRFK